MPEHQPSSIHHCNRCGEPIATASPTGLCPGCMFGGALGLEPSEVFESDGAMDPVDPPYDANEMRRMIHEEEPPKPRTPQPKSKF